MTLKRMNGVVKYFMPVLLILFVALFANLIYLTSNSQQLRRDSEELASIGNEILYNNDYLIKLLRVYTVSRDPAVFDEYNAMLSDDATLNDKLARLVEIGLSSVEQGHVSAMDTLLTELADIEGEALAAMDSGDAAAASAIVCGPDYLAADNDLAAKTKLLIGEIAGRTNAEQRSLELRLQLWSGVTGAFVLLSMFAATLLIRWTSKKIFWYDSILDSLPSPLSVTDMNRNWTFINKPVEDMLGLKREDVLGKACRNWGAGICETGNCGINCLENGIHRTTFEQAGMDFKVDVSYLIDQKKQRVGHIEVVEDISQLMKTQKAEEKLVREIGEVSATFIEGSRQIAGSAQSLAENSSQQAASSEELAASISELAGKTRQNATMANEAANLAGSIKDSAEKGSGQMNEMVSAVNDITLASESIGKVIKAIDDIAFQTNILALNAAVEAARAGQHGKGFAVVADEVRNLAAKSAEAAKDTGVLITNTIEKARLGKRIASDTAGSLSEIVTGINESSAIVAKIARSSEEQSISIDQINASIGQVAQVIQECSATTQESAAAADVLNKQSLVLNNLLMDFDYNRA